MSVPARPKTPTTYLRVFFVSLTLVLLGLGGFLFGVRMEAVVPATGIIKARDQQEVRALIAGLIDLGWQAAEIPGASGKVVAARLDPDGNGLTDPGQGKSLAVRGYVLEDESGKAVPLHFHKLQAGDVLWPGQVLGRVRTDELRLELSRVEERLIELQSQGQSDQALLSRRDLLRGRMAQAVLRTPAGAWPWLVLKVRVEPLAAVRPGDAIVLIAPCDPTTKQPRDLIAELTLSEAQSQGLEPGQAVRLYSTMFNHRVHGHAEARLERIDPFVEEGPGGERQLRGLAAITVAPFALPLGSSFRAEIVTGRKAVYRIILEH
jgi:hypothetical protein